MTDTRIFTEIIDNIMVYIPKIPMVVFTLALGILLIRFIKKATIRIMNRMRLDTTIISFTTAFITLYIMGILNLFIIFYFRLPSNQCGLFWQYSFNTCGNSQQC